MFWSWYSNIRSWDVIAKNSMIQSMRRRNSVDRAVKENEIRYSMNNYSHLYNTNFISMGFSYINTYSIIILTYVWICGVGFLLTKHDVNLNMADHLLKPIKSIFRIHIISRDASDIAMYSASAIVKATTDCFLHLSYIHSDVHSFFVFFRCSWCITIALEKWNIFLRLKSALWL